MWRSEAALRRVAERCPCRLRATARRQGRLQNAKKLKERDPCQFEVQRKPNLLKVNLHEKRLVAGVSEGIEQSGMMFDGFKM